MKSRRFRATILSGHKEDAVEVPFDPAREWNAKSVPIRVGRRGCAVRATLAGCSFESFLVQRSRRSFLLLPPKILKRVGVTVGDVVEVSVAPGAPMSKPSAARKAASRASRKRTGPRDRAQ